MKKIAFLLLFALSASAQTKSDLSGAAALFDLPFTTQELDTLLRIAQFYQDHTRHEEVHPTPFL